MQILSGGGIFETDRKRKIYIFISIYTDICTYPEKLIDRQIDMDQLIDIQRDRYLDRQIYRYMLEKVMFICFRRKTNGHSMII